MSLRGYLPGKEVTSPRGAWTVLANKRKGRPDRASFAQNVRFDPGVVASRHGISPVQFAVGVTKGIFNWIAPDGTNWVIYREGPNITALNQTLAVPHILLSPIGTMYRPSFSDLLVWTYFCGANTAGVGQERVRIFDGQNVDIAFRPAVAIDSFSAADTGAGQATLGTHFFGFVYQNRTGYSTVPTTQVGDPPGGPPFSITLGTGNRQVTITVTLSPLADGGLSANGNIQAKLFLIATPANNPNQWFFVPAAVPPSTTIEQQDVPHLIAATLTFVFDIDDTALYQADDALTQFQLLTDTDGNGPIKPQFIVAYGTRMCYAAGTKMYVSDQSNPQRITEADNVVLMPNQRYIGAAFPLPGGTSLYLSGDKWTSYATDNSGTPSTWSEPISVSQNLGASLQNLICNKTGGNYAWVITEGGPYLFNGAFESKPITFLVQDQWKRVNWQAAYAIEIADNSTELKLYIAVPLDGATEPTHTFVFDYQNGQAFDAVDFSIDKYDTATFGGIGVVRETNDATNLWIGPSAVGSISHFDPASHNDNGAAVASIWKSGLMRGNEIATKMLRVSACDIWARGNGTLNIAVGSLYDKLVVNPPLLILSGFPTTLTDEPGLIYATRFDLAHVEDWTFQVGTNAVNEWFELSGLVSYQKADRTNR